MGWTVCCHAHTKIRAPSYSILVSGKLFSIYVSLASYLAQQILALGFLIGCTFAPNLATLTGNKTLTSRHNLIAYSYAMFDCSFWVSNAIFYTMFTYHQKNCTASHSPSSF